VGLIQKQSISGVIWSYLGVVLGFITTAFLYTKFLSTEQIGLLRLLVSYSSILAIFASLGMNSVTIKLFPYFRDADKKHNGFLGIALIFSMLGFLLASLVYVLFQPLIIENAQEKSALFIPYFFVVIPLTFFTVLFLMLDTYYRVLHNAVKGIVYKEVVQRVLIIVALILYFFNLIDFMLLVWLNVFAYVVPAILFIISLNKTRQFHLKPGFAFVDKKLKKEMISVGFFGILSSFSGVLVQSVDVIMVSDYLGLSFTGVYAICFFFGTLILIPMRTMGKIGSVVIADAWKENDTLTIASIYKKSSLSLSVLGLLLFLGIWGNIDNVFHLIGDKYLGGRYVIFFIGLANLTDVFMGMSSHIVVNSKYYRWQTYLLAIFAILVVVSNILLIPVYGIIGAALATLISKFIFNGLKYLFVYKRFGFQPFIFKHVLLIVVSAGAWYVSTLMPALPNYILDIIVRSILITILFALPVYYLNISVDINEKVDSILAVVGIKLRSGK
jgi:O-antigen/teichoic acid export membrane protein